MEKTNLENKLLTNIKKNMDSLNNSLQEASELVNKALKSRMTKDEYAKYKAFNTKYLRLISNGKIIEAKELEKKYKGGE